MSGPWQGGKGDRVRPFDQKKWDKNYDRIFGKNHRIRMATRKGRIGKESTDETV